VIPSGRLVREIEPHGLLSFGDQLAAYQCHHHSLFLDQTVSDALGGEGWAVRQKAAFESAHALLASFCAEFGIIDAEDRLEIAREIFAAMGHGRLTFEISAEGGAVRGHELYCGSSFVEKYGQVIKNRRPVDSFAAGYISAAASLAFPSDWGTLEAEETTCKAQRSGAAECVFSLSRRPERPRFGLVVTRPLVEQILINEGGLDEPRGSRIEADRSAMDLSRMIHGAATDREGALLSFGVRLALYPVSYINQITYETVHLIEKRTPELFPVVSALLREAACIGAFHLLAGVLASAPWQAEHGPPARDPEVRLAQLTGLTRALGWGSLYAADFVPGRCLTLRSGATQESAYYAIRHGPTVRTRLFFQQGLALAIMQILHRVDFSAAAPIKRDTYDALFKAGTRFHVEETRSLLRGDRFCEVTIEALADR
jgi:predicted hydrocarbon binding protein